MMHGKDTSGQQRTQSSFLRTTPFPNVLLDEAMPHLRDTEWRLLCVIVRQTRGWRDNASSRKERDWLTQAQLKRRTGRDSAALSKALDALVQRGLVAVHDRHDRPLATPQERRGHSGPLFYSLGTAAMPSSASQSELRKANITKETVTKIFTIDNEKSEQLASEQHNGAGQETTTAPEEKNPTSETLDSEVVRFVQEYKRMFREHRGSAPLPPVFRHDLEHLQDLLAAHSWERLRELLEVFFTSDARFIKQRGYSLGAFVTSINILKVIRPKAGQPRPVGPQPATHTGPGSIGSWFKADGIAARQLTSREDTHREEAS